MRFLMTLILNIILVTPAFGASVFCNIDDPEDCLHNNEAQLVALTRDTIHTMQFTQVQHPFVTENDVVLSESATQHAALAPAAHSAQTSQTGQSLFGKLFSFMN